MSTRQKIILLVSTLIMLAISTPLTSASGQEPKAPTNLRATAGNGLVVLTWDSMANTTTYNLYFSRHTGIDKSNYSNKLGMRITNTRSPFQLTGLNNGTVYYFIVTAINSFGESISSNEVNATPQTDSLSPLQFENISKTAGLVQIKQQAFGNPLIGDLNNDDNMDIIDPHHSVSLSVYLNNGNETFTDITNESGIYNLVGIDRHGMTLGDYNNDGNIDLFIATGISKAGPQYNNSQLWEGDGSGNFVDVATEANINTLPSRSANWVDYDNDGYLDLFVAFEGGTQGIVYKNNGNGTFSDVTNSTGLNNAFDIVMSFADYDNDGDIDLFVGGWKSDRLYHNNGDGSFSLNDSFVGKGANCRGVAWGDYNNDGFVDLYVSRGTNDYYKTFFWDQSRIDFSYLYFIDPGDISFRCTPHSSITFDLLIQWQGRKTSYIFIGSDRKNPSKNPFTLNCDEVIGKPQFNPGQEEGFFIWKEDTDNIWHIQWTKSTQGLGPPFWGHIISSGNFFAIDSNSPTLDTNFKNTFYRNNGDGSFTDITEESRAGHIGNNSGVSWGDFDNDGYLDLYVVDASDILGNRINTLYRNLGDWTFEDITISARVDALNAVGRHYGSTWGDLNNDGFLDLLLSNGFGWGYPLANGISMLYKNLGNSNNWLKLKLVGRMSNRSAIGSRVILSTPKGIQTRQLNGQGGELYSQGLTPVHFGVGSEEVIDYISIFWPSGFEQTIHSVPTNQTLTIIEADDVYTEAQSIPYWYVKLDGSPAFVDVSNKIAGDYSIGTVRNGSGAVAMQLRFPKKVALDPTNTSLHFQAYSEDFNEKIQFIRLHAPNWENRFIYRYNHMLPLNDGEWTKIDLNLSDFIPEAGSPDWNNISLMTINYYGGKSLKHINIDQLYFDTIRP